MMKKKYDLRGNKRVAMLLLTLISVFLFPLQAMANPIDEQSYYTFENYGVGVLKIKMPIYNKYGRDHWVKEATLKIVGLQDEDSFSNETCVLGANIVKNTDIDDDDKTVAYKFYTEEHGLVELVSESNHMALISTPKQVSISFKGNSLATAEFDWYVPVRYRGKQVKFRWKVERNTTEHEKNESVFETVVDIPDKSDLMDPVLTSAIISGDIKYKGEILIPWMISVNDSLIESVKYGYTDATGQRHIVDMDATASGNIRLDATGVYDSLYVSVNYWSWDEQKKAKTLAEDRTSDYYDVPTLHAPLGLKATPIYGPMIPKVQLDWYVDYPNREDLFDLDNFQVQRSISGEEDDFRDIYSELFSVGDSLYTFNDSTILDVLKKSDFDKDGLLHPVYRIRRTASSQWGWSGNPLAVTDSLKNLRICLLTPTRADGEIIDDEKHILKVTWEYMQSDSIIFAWDDKAEMKLIVKMRRVDGTMADSLEYVLTRAEITQKTKNITLPRSCVTYELYIITTPKDSPLEPYLTRMTIGSKTDWAEFIRNVKEGKTVYATLTADVEIESSLSQIVGYDEEHPFSGVFDANGHRLMMKSTRVSPFRFVNNAIFRNVWLTGEANYVSRAGGFVEKGENIVFQNCRADYTYANHNNVEFGGFINIGSRIRFTNCLFAGNVSNSNQNFNGYLWRPLNSANLRDVVYSCCVFAPAHPYIGGNPSGGLEGLSNLNNKSKLKSFYVLPKETDARAYASAYQVLPSTLSEQLGVLGMQWQAVEEWPGFAPISSYSRQDNCVETPVAAENLYFDPNGRVKENSLVAETRQSSVMLTWEIEGGAIDFFQVLRRPKGKTKWDIVSPDIYELGFEDTTVSPVIDYEYKVRSATDCEGLIFNETSIVEGACLHSGKVEGYVRYADGTGVPGIRVNIEGGDVETYATTDDTGHYMKDLLSYQNQLSINYIVTPQKGKAQIEYEEGNGSYNVEFNDSSNYTLVPDFIIVSGQKFTGKVLYSGTTIPVPGVQFEVDGHRVHSPSGKVLETDSEGKFCFYVNKGNNKIQALKDDHSFWQDGWYKGEEGRDYGVNIHGDVSSVVFYDKTKVKLIGRVVGGNDQGLLPLGNSLSTNNLGDSIVIVMALEGDNKSRLVYDNLDPLKEQVDTVFIHNSHDQGTYKTRMTTTRRNIKIIPDSLTGEYSVELPPVKWKIQQVYATGYSSLFKEGKVSEVIDLTDSLTKHKDVIKGLFISRGGNEVQDAMVEYNAIYNCIWHAPVELTYKQLGFNNFGFFGDQFYAARNIDGSKATVPLAYEVKNDSLGTGAKVAYTFGHPVFSIEHQYPFQLSAVERYYWNNNKQSDTIDVVHMHGGKVRIHNGMVSSTHHEEVDLDENGEALVSITAAQVPYLLTRDDALRTITMSLTLDGTSYEAEPLNAYVLNIYELPGAPDIMSVGQPILVDILRDPPGGGSSATLSKGSTLKYNYSVEIQFKLGSAITIATGSQLSTYTGAVAAPTGAGATAGVINLVSSDYSIGLNLIVNGRGKRAFSYTMTALHDISTSSNPLLVGAPADIFIGIQQSVVMKPATTIRAIPHSFFVQMGGDMAAGRVVEIARGQHPNGEIFHLVRDESVTVGPKFESTFTHSQKHIVTTVMPGIMNQCKSMMFTGSQEEAKIVANKTGKPVYLSLVSEDDDNFAIMNTKDVKDSNGEMKKEYVCYTNRSEDLEGMNYRIILPDGYNMSSLRDSVYQLNQTLLAWVKMLATNEKEKLSATELVKNFDVDGGVGMSYAEDFKTEYDYEYQLQIPFFTDVYDNFFMSGGAGAGIGLPVYEATLGLSYLMAKYITKLSGNTPNSNIGHGYNKPAEDDVEVSVNGTYVKVSFQPALALETIPKFGRDTSWSRKESFKISMDKNSHLNFDVYRAKTVAVEDVSDDDMDVFTSEEFYDNISYNNDYISRYFKTSNFKRSCSFVYRTRGGATCRPYEGGRYTAFYKIGEILDQPTKQIEKPTIRLDKQSVSGVPHGEPARFQLFLANESEAPECAYPLFNLFLDDKGNNNGATLKVDGMPLTRDGFSVTVEPGEVTQKTLEVYASSGFDYEGLTVGLKSMDDINVFDKVSFDVHFLHTAGNINISSPRDKWVMNTDAPHDKRGYHIPVVIDGFDKNQHNFDHVEFQYKESDRGDDYWTNQCSYYVSDSLFQLASGTKDMIPQNGNITTEFYGELEVMEKAYDLRAVLFCRNGNDYITSSSKVLSGIKDTRRPQLFGTPEPIDGFLDAGDNIVFNFSEAIEANYLDDFVNFEVKGEVNNDDLTRQVCLRFSGDGCAESEARRNFAGKDITIDMMVKPDDTGEEMPLFSHGTPDNSLQLWITKDKRLKAIVGRNTTPFISDSTINIRDFRHIAMVIKQPKDLEANSKWQLTFYDDENNIGSFDMEYAYTGVGPIILGASNEASARRRKYYTGRMMEVRLWYRALTGSLFGTYGYKRLSGYEMGLADYYPLNEGVGNNAADQAQGAHLSLGTGVGWTLPEGMSLHLDLEDRGMPLKESTFNRNDEQDYTLMFWFKTTQKGRGVLISNGAGEADEIGARNRFYIGFDSEKLLFRSNGRTIEVPGYYSDDKWHHYAITVNRAHNVGNIYVDQALRSTFSVDTLGGMSGGHPMLGAARKSKVNVDGNTVVEDTRNWLTGNIDEICFFEQALPATLVKAYSTRSPQGDEKGLISYMGFSRQERQADNSIMWQPYAYSQKIHKDHGKIVYETDPETGKPTTTPKRDFLFADGVTEEMVLNHIQTDLGAPVCPNEDLTNLDFSFVGKDNQLLVNINEIDEKINKRNIYVTVRDIPDLNGNEMASPVTACYFVDRNPLRWGKKNIQEELIAGLPFEIHIPIINQGATSHIYTVEGCPKWLAVTPYTNIIGPRGEVDLTFIPSRDINVGTYDEIIYLTDENGLSEPLPLTLTVTGNDAQFWVHDEMKNYNMSFTGRVIINDAVDTDIRDQVGAFDQNDQCHGLANIDYDEKTGESNLYMTIYNETTEHTPLYFKLKSYSTGKEMLLTPEIGDTITFNAQAVLGRDEPIILVANNLYVQRIDFERGWNWFSTNVYHDDMRRNLRYVLEKVEWSDGDAFVDNTDNLSMIYTNGHWMLTDSLSKFTLQPQRGYCVKVKYYTHFSLTGSFLDQEYERTITLKEGWNYIGYTPMVNLPVTTALADYRDFASNGDVIKSHDEFAVLHITAQNSYQWKGNLKYMKPGQGYMLLHQGEGTCSFTYPFFEPGSLYFEDAYQAPARHVNPDKAFNMSLSAMTEGIDLEEGDRLLAYADGELCGEAMATDDDGVFYMSIGGDQPRPLWFAIERDGDIIATTPEVLKYETNAVVGTPDSPTRIDFTHRNLTQHGWYTLQGFKLPSRPTKKGVYIFNGKKIVVE